MSQISEEKRTLKYQLVNTSGRHQFLLACQHFGPSHQVISYPMHDHDYFEFFLVTGGKFTHRINGTEETLSPGDLKFILPHDVHQLVPEPGKELTIYNCNISNDLFQNCFRFLTAGELSPDELQPTVHLNGHDFQELLHQMQETLFFSSRSNIFRSRMLGRALIIRVLEIFLKQQDGTISRPQWLEQLCSQMQKPENFRRGVSRMFELTNYTPEHISRSVKKYLGMTPQQLILEYKMQSVVHDLVYSDMSINVIAFQNGFQNYAYFHRAFVKRWECTPLNFRKRHSADN